MKLTGEVTIIEVEGVTFFVTLNWGQMKSLVRDLAKLDDDDTLGIFAFMDENLLKIVKRVEGLEDAEGNSIIALSQEVLDKLLPDFVMEVWARITSAGEDTADGTTIPLADSSEPEPESSPKGSE